MSVLPVLQGDRPGSCAGLDMGEPEMQVPGETRARVLHALRVDTRVQDMADWVATASQRVQERYNLPRRPTYRVCGPWAP
jgi:hypothetical protein